MHSPSLHTLPSLPVVFSEVLHQPLHIAKCYLKLRLSWTTESSCQPSLWMSLLSMLSLLLWADFCGCRRLYLVSRISFCYPSFCTLSVKETNLLLWEGLDLFLLLGALGLDFGVHLQLKRTLQTLVHWDSFNVPYTPRPTVAMTILMLVSRPSCKLLLCPPGEG